MPQILRPDGAVIHFEIAGSGDPILALAPGGISSEASRWSGSVVGSLAALESRFTVIVMDQRHAGHSRAALVPFSYDEMLADQVAVLDAAGVRRAHVLGAGLAAAHALKLAYDAPARVAAVALIHPRGVDGDVGIGAHYAIFNETIRIARAEGLEGVIDAAVANPSFVENPAAGPWARRLHDEPPFRDALRSLGRELYITLVVDFRDGVFPWGRRFFSVNDVAIGRINAPLLIAPGSDALHPPSVGSALGSAARRAQLLEAGAAGKALSERLCAFFSEHAGPA